MRNKKREVIYEQRRDLVEAENVHDVIEDMSEDFATSLSEEFLDGRPDEWNTEGLAKAMQEGLGIEADMALIAQGDDVAHAGDMTQKIIALMTEALQNKEQLTGVEQMRGFEKWLILQVLDHHWKEHLLAMDHLRQSVGLRGYAQKQPIQEYKRESFELFERMLAGIRKQTMQTLYNVQVEQQEEVEATPAPEPEQIVYNRAEPEEPVQTFTRQHPKVGRNEACPCGSGKKYKHCHGKR